LLVFYLAAPPRRAERGQDFRTLPNAPERDEEAVLDALIRDLMARQALVRSALVDEEAAPLPWIGSQSIQIDPTDLVSQIRSDLAFDLERFRRARTPADAFALLREVVESRGVFVLLISNLGSHHTALDAEVFRGMAIADAIAPFIVINDQDSKSAWSFTLLHELVHLYLGFTGVSGGAMEQSVERFCNQVASELLLPASEFAQFRIAEGLSDDEVADLISGFAAERNVSRTMVTYRLLLRRSISQRQWNAISALFRDQWIRNREEQREARRGEIGGPSYYTVRRNRLGAALLGTTARLLRSGTLTTVKAGQVLGVRPSNVRELMATVPAFAQAVS
jgi:Zn-dependent peptidase ImmA (M78 family)